jgi:hypothetical protein
VNPDVLMEALEARRCGSCWMARCPAHDDRTPSLSIKEADGLVLVHCHAGCSQQAVIAAWESDQYRDLCFQILRENGFLPKFRLCFVNLRDVPGGLPPDELRRFLKEHGAETIGIPPRRD